ncbi:MAG: hypothetical protein UT84_C0002G0024 [Candidatus Curtissbacteria bacterium GW2011_GWA1_40_16]|uniref:Bacterial spore germination immunoglobulin-like domain-containing protein n=1 Tax=Candidatus Curtissbacteria bacterium GW2011_GWA1_40_16 TaxID=1618405 RepID=A0A0G0RFG3_9BACT|nr:MAG: hypothetical protein UT84_C0002G0024 [Candidatus Curtissbacteria bacterium GW2011_GWA1_40_16]
MNNLKVAILLIVIFVLAISGFYYIYLKQVSKSQSLILPPLESPKTNFPSATASASPISKTQSIGDGIKQPGAVAETSTFPQSQPETGAGQTQITDAGIFIQNPQAQAKISSPVTINGMANVPNNLIVEVKDATGQVLGVRKTTACFGNQSCPFSVSVVFTKPNTPNGQITVYSPSLSTNNPEYSQTVAISF